MDGSEARELKRKVEEQNALVEKMRLQQEEWERKVAETKKLVENN